MALIEGILNWESQHAVAGSCWFLPNINEAVAPCHILPFAMKINEMFLLSSRARETPEAPQSRRLLSTPDTQGRSKMESVPGLDSPLVSSPLLLPQQTQATQRNEILMRSWAGAIVLPRRLGCSAFLELLIVKILTSCVANNLISMRRIRPRLICWPLGWSFLDVFPDSKPHKDRLGCGDILFVL